MDFKQFYLGCLSHASYYLGSGDEAVVIDPQRDVDQYIAEAEGRNQKIKYVIETHSHADFVSGHIELAERTGAEIVFGKRAATTFPTLKVGDGDELSIGTVRLRFIETPGHTPEGVTVIAQDATDSSSPAKMFTGDTLFIGDVGRPDLVGSKGFTAEEMASMLYDSLHEKILKFPDETEVYPAHGAGSLCGKSLSKETWSTLGEQRKSNYALQPMTKEEFVKIVAEDQLEVPQYFPKSAAKNLEGSVSLGDLPKPVKMSDSEALSFDGILIDIRPGAEFGAGHILNSVNIGLGGQFASWSGTMISVGTPIVLVGSTEDQIDEGFMRLARVGIESVKGYVLIPEWKSELAIIEQISVDEAKSKLSAEPGIQFIDVRRQAEHATGHAAGTRNIPLDSLPREADSINPDLPVMVICQSGYRSSLATSLLENAGVRRIYNVTGGTQAWIGAGLETEAAESSCSLSR
jgi:glyoxylase-like metal-dependent hydrolase (beta-lactamase superfamily II)/rhodanese-related sulfurtransferase